MRKPGCIRKFTLLPALILACASYLASADFDYYVLSLSWAPDFCAASVGNKDPLECGRGRNVGFVVHGLWPQDERGRGPEKCGNSRPVARATVNSMLAYIPSPSLIQHEWREHGVCTELSAGQFFAQVRQARDSVQIPKDLEGLHQRMEIATADVETRFENANPRFPPGAFRATCSGETLQEVRVCFTKNLAPRACSLSAGECRSRNMMMLPRQ